MSLKRINRCHSLPSQRPGSTQSDVDSLMLWDGIREASLGLHHDKPRQWQPPNHGHCHRTHVRGRGDGYGMCSKSCEQLSLSCLPRRMTSAMQSLHVQPNFKYFITPCHCMQPISPIWDVLGCSHSLCVCVSPFVRNPFAIAAQCICWMHGIHLVDPPCLPSPSFMFGKRHEPSTTLCKIQNLTSTLVDKFLCH